MPMRKLKLGVPTAIVFGALVLNLVPAHAKPEYTKTEKKPCVTCHVTAKSKDLNKVGECYKTKKSLKECEVK